MKMMLAAAALAVTGVFAHAPAQAAIAMPSVAAAALAGTSDVTATQMVRRRTVVRVGPRCRSVKTRTVRMYRGRKVVRVVTRRRCY